MNMKLRNLLFGTMIACAFVACSNDDDPINGGGGENPTGKTLLQVKPNVITTKATAAGTDFWVYVIDPSGTIVGEGKAGEQFELTDSRAEGNVEIIVLKNMPKSMGAPMVKADLFKAIDFSTDEESDLTSSQNTAVYNVSIQRGAINKLGYDNVETEGVHYLDNSGEPIPAYRNVARIVFNSVTIANNVITGQKVKYTNPKLKLKEAFILNARNSSKMASETVLTRWATTENANGVYCNGVDYVQYKKWEDEVLKEGKVPYISTIAEDSYKTFVAPDWSTNNMCFNGYLRTIFDKSVKHPVIDLSDGESQDTCAPSNLFFYTYENTNTDNPTLLVLKADFTYDEAAGTADDPNATKEVTMEDRYYTIKIGENISLDNSFNTADFGITDASAIKGIRRNIAYAIDLTVKGPGSKNPLIPGEDEATYMNAAVTLVGYGIVNQTPSID